MTKVKGAWGQEFEVADDNNNQQPQDNLPPQQQESQQQQNADTNQPTDQPNDDKGNNYSEWLSSVSDGLIKDEDGFKSVLPKIKQYDEIKGKYDEIEGKYKDLESKVPKFEDDYSRSVYEAIQSKNEDKLAEYLDEKRRDYNTMSDIDVVKWSLKKQNPEWSQKDIDAQVRYTYGKSLEKKDLSVIDREESPKDYAAAELYNEAIEDKILKLEIDSRDARILLNKQKAEVKLPEITKQAPEAPKQPTPEEIAKNKKEWEDYVEAKMAELSDLSVNVDGEEVGYKFTDEDKTALRDNMKSFDAARDFTELGWRDEKGTLIPDKIAKDKHIIQNIDKLLKSAFTQGKTAGKKEVAADIKNLNFTPKDPGGTSPVKDVWQRQRERYATN